MCQPGHRLTDRGQTLGVDDVFFQHFEFRDVGGNFDDVRNIAAASFQR